MRFVAFIIVALLISAAYTARDAILELMAGGLNFEPFSGLLIIALASAVFNGGLPLLAGYFVARARSNMFFGLIAALVVTTIQVYAYPKLFAINDLTLEGVVKVVNRTSQIPMYVEECSVNAIAFLLGWLAASSLSRRKAIGHG